VHEYRGGRLPLFHADLYRLQRTTVEELGLDERAIEQGVLAIEWPERLAHSITNPVVVELRIVDEQRRELTFR
jgi:tRNA threonylcarbamoyladenosine biosynthesis protein TsaE